MLEPAQFFASIGVLVLLKLASSFVFFSTTLLYFAGTSVDFCYHHLFDLLEPALNFASLLPPVFWFAGTSFNFCYHQGLVCWDAV